MLIEWIIRALAVIGVLALVVVAWGIWLTGKDMEGYE